MALAAAEDISTVGGSPGFGFGGDSGPATIAKLHNSSGVVPDSSGNVFIADQFNHRIRKVDSSGDISTVAGSGTAGVGEGEFSGDGGPATGAEMERPTGVAVDSSGNISIADRNNGRIRKVDTSGNISTVAGNGDFGFSGDGGPATSAQLWNPRGVAFDSSGNLFIADSNNHSFRKVEAVAAASPVPGMSTGGLIGLATLLAAVGFVLLGRRSVRQT